MNSFFHNIPMFPSSVESSKQSRLIESTSVKGSLTSGMNSRPQCEVDWNLYKKLNNALQRLGSDLARENGDGIMPHHIFGDATLQQISEKVPRTKKELYEINGLSEVRVGKYEERVLETIEATIKELYKGDLTSNGSNDDGTESIKRKRDANNFTDDDFLTESTKKRMVELNPSAKLYSALRMLRNDLSSEAIEKIMSYNIVGNTTLVQISKKVPRTREELLEIDGICKVKSSRFGERILETIEATIKEFYKGDRNDSTESIKREIDADLETSRKDFVDFKDFSVIVNGISLDSQLSESHLFRNYYELCLSRKSYIHEHILSCICPGLASGIIIETVHIANAIQSCVISTSDDDFKTWDRALRSFELLGLKVGFLLSRLTHLRGLAAVQDTPEFKRLNAAKLELTRLEKEIVSFRTTTDRLLKDENSVLREEDAITVEMVINRLKDFKNKLQSEIDTLTVSVHQYELKFEEIARASW